MHADDNNALTMMTSAVPNEILTWIMMDNQNVRKIQANLFSHYKL